MFLHEKAKKLRSMTRSLKRSGVKRIAWIEYMTFSGPDDPDPLYSKYITGVYHSKDLPKRSPIREKNTGIALVEYVGRLELVGCADGWLHEDCLDESWLDRRILFVTGSPRIFDYNDDKAWRLYSDLIG